MIYFSYVKARIKDLILVSLFDFRKQGNMLSAFFNLVSRVMCYLGLAQCSILYPQKSSEMQTYSDGFRGYRNGTLS